MTHNQDVAHSLLQLMRDPESVIERVAETCSLGKTVAERRLSLTLSPNSMAVKDGHVFVDVLHVPKGSLIELEVHSEGIGRVSHGEHLAVSELMIRYRFLSVWGTADGLTGSAKREFKSAMVEASEDLATIPYLSQRRAGELLRKHFAESGVLKCVLLYPGLVINAVRMQWLYKLVKRLADRYLVLLKVPIADGNATTVEYTYDYEVSSYVFGSDSHKKKSTRRVTGLKRKRLRKIGKSAAVRFARRPSSFRAHVPWAKRTKHYTIRLETPDGYFAARRAVLAWRDNDVSEIAVDDPLPLKWSIDSSQGRSVAAFMSDAALVAPTLYVGVQFVDVPSGPTSRAVELAWIAFGVLFSFLALILLGEGPAFEAGALILAIAAVGAFASAPTPGGGALGTPLIARQVPKYVAYLIAAFVLWFASRAAIMADSVRRLASSDVLEIVREAWHWWEILGGPLIVATSLVVAAVVTRRWHLGIRLYSNALRESAMFSSNFYQK